jgi:hypothetical protein
VFTSILGGRQIAYALGRYRIFFLTMLTSFCSCWFTRLELGSGQAQHAL